MPHCELSKLAPESRQIVKHECLARRDGDALCSVDVHASVLNSNTIPNLPAPQPCNHDPTTVQLCSKQHLARVTPITANVDTHAHLMALVTKVSI